MLNITSSGSIECVLPFGIGGFDSNSEYRFFDIWCDYLYFSITTREPVVKENKKEYVHSYLYLVNPFKRFTKVVYFGKFIFIVELCSHASR